ncbi:YisL family protein [Pontibacillus salipaludis]|uniref:UPF0344 protein YisL n=1 Tax=Pontibacillus salipaludis TaxID=1697394 RepID=A0ABQ1Q8A9_9BACI|nr:YisL family protein [Pontibacillus salipaludis]GGD17753.1 UPF0344 protein YisL [Pontibacillus salipaludis]
MDGQTHLHITSWVLALILLGLTVWFDRLGKPKIGKVFHMILRLDYLLILYSGGSLIAVYFANAGGAMLGEAIIKSLAGLWVIFAVEMIAVRAKKRVSAKSAWIQFFIAIIIALVLGFGRLPMGILPLN